MKVCLCENNSCRAAYSFSHNIQIQQENAYTRSEIFSKATKKGSLVAGVILLWEYTSLQHSDLMGDRCFQCQDASSALCFPMDSIHGMRSSDLCLCLFLLKEMRVFYSGSF